MYLLITSHNSLKYLKFIVFAAVAGSTVYIFLFTPEGNYFVSPEGRKELVSRIDSLVSSAGWFGPIVFSLIYSIAVLVLPATPFTAAGAFFFGKYFGILTNVLGATLGASISFFLGRYFLRDFAKGFLVGKLNDLDQKAGEHGFSIIFYLRTLWFPFIVLNYGAGATRICFSDYFWGTLFGMFPSILVSTLLFGSIKEIMANYRTYSDLFQFDILVPAAVLAFSFFLPAIVNRFRRKKSSPLETIGNRS
jgi:uncharacterized membrane protein YdjX (TVP38/TMEM64 family)